MSEGKTIGQLMEEMRAKAGAQNYHGHGYMDLQRFAVDNHCLPITPHIYFTQFMNDEDERAEAVLMNNILLSYCRELWVFGDVISKGMSEEIKQAKRKYMKIRYFTAEMEEKK